MLDKEQHFRTKKDLSTQQYQPVLLPAIRVRVTSIVIVVGHSTTPFPLLRDSLAIKFHSPSNLNGGLLILSTEIRTDGDDDEDGVTRV